MCFPRCCALGNAFFFLSPPAGPQQVLEVTPAFPCELNSFFCVCLTQHWTHQQVIISFEKLWVNSIRRHLNTVSVVRWVCVTLCRVISGGRVGVTSQYTGLLMIMTGGFRQGLPLQIETHLEKAGRLSPWSLLQTGPVALSWWETSWATFLNMKCVPCSLSWLLTALVLSGFKSLI